MTYKPKAGDWAIYIGNTLYVRHTHGDIRIRRGQRVLISEVFPRYVDIIASDQEQGVSFEDIIPACSLALVLYGMGEMRI